MEIKKRNSNELTYVHINDAKFFSNALGVSKPAFDLVTSKEVFDISTGYLGKSIRLNAIELILMKNIIIFRGTQITNLTERKILNMVLFL